MALAIVISRCTPKLSHWSNCTSSYLILFFHTIPYSPRKIFGYWKDFLSVTRKASVFSGSILSPLLSNQRYDRNSIWGCSFQQVVWKLLPHYRLYLTIWICKLCSCVGFKPFARSLKFFESEKLFVLDHAGTLFLSLEWLYLWNQALHNVLDSIGIAQDGAFLLVTNLLVTILKARPHGSFLTPPIKSYPHWSRLLFMPCLRAVLAVFHASLHERVILQNDDARPHVAKPV